MTTTRRPLIIFTDFVVRLETGREPLLEKKKLTLERWKKVDGDEPEGEHAAEIILSVVVGEGVLIEAGHSHGREEVVEESDRLGGSSVRR